MPVFTDGQLEALCKVLADTYFGLKGSEIGDLLSRIGVDDTASSMTKWKRLLVALANRQSKDQSGDRVFAFIAAALEPARFQDRGDEYRSMISDVNVSLSYVGFEFREDGKFYKRKPAATHSEAHARADRLRTKLEQRNVHPDVLMYCRAELLAQDCFHAVLEACKSVAGRIRSISGSDGDGAPLVQEAFGGKSPLILINAFQSETDKGEQRGFVNLASGLFGTFRNPTAHEARIHWPISEEDALDLLSLASYVHRRLDNAKSVDDERGSTA